MKENKFRLLKLILLFFTFPLLGMTQNKKNDCPVNESILWTVIYDNDNYLVRSKKIDDVKDDVKKLIKTWNDHSWLKIEFVKNAYKTVFIKIPDSYTLTQSLGTTGAQNTVASLIFSLTENPNCKYVYIDCEDGDHFSSGIYDRRDFEDDFYICY